MGNVKIAITLREDVYNLLTEMSRKENRSKSQQISWVIRQSKEAKAAETEAQKEPRMIRPPLSIWQKGAV